LPEIRSLERRLASWEGRESALVFSSGFITNLALVSTLVGQDDAIFSDELNHASLIDGCRLSRARVCVYHHGDAEHLRYCLMNSPRSRRRLIVTDSIFSMDGDFAPLSELLRLAHSFDALLVIDEAHATGVIGPSGRGLTELLISSADEERLIKVGTLSKALGAQGGFVAGSRRQITWLVNHARPYIFSTALAPPIAAAARRAIAIVQEEPQRRTHLAALADRLRSGVRALGIDTGKSSCHIVPLIIGGTKQAVALSSRLLSLGFLVPAIRPPAVPPGTERLRMSVTAAHTLEDVERLLDALRKV